MRVRGAATVVLSSMGLVAATVPAADATVLRGPTYYVSLGDSLSKGYQPGMGETNQGYADFLHKRLKSRDKRLRLVKLGCSGENTTTFIKGGRCSYQGAASQLKAAEKFLRANRQRVRYVTIDIGGNDVGGCAPGGSVDVGCALAGLGTIGGNLPKITKALRNAAGPRARLLAMNYYDPYLAAWLQGASGRQLAQLSLALVGTMNGLEAAVYRGAGFRVADVAAAFSSFDFAHQDALPGAGRVPRNVHRICTWTYMCARNDIHANTTGYQVIARAFEPLI